MNHNSSGQSSRVELLLVNGRTVSFSLPQLRRFLWTRSILLMGAGALFFLLLGNPYFFSAVSHTGSRVFYWSVGIVLYLWIMPYYLWGAYRVWSLFTDKPLFHIGPTIPLIVGVTYFLLGLARLSGDLMPEVTGPVTLSVHALNVVIATILECIGLYWIYPTYQNSMRAPQNDNAFVHINGSEIPISAIQLVKSDSRYLVITTKTGTSRHICRMRDFLAQVTEQDGLSPHRSYWVAKQNIIGLVGAKIKVHNGNDIPVARSKVDASKLWLRENGLQH